MFFVAGLLLACAFSASAVTWEARELVLTAEPGVAKVDGAFVFTNETQDPFEITAVRTSCGCTTAKLEQTTYAPGESGEIKVAFAVGDRTGEQVKKVVVRTDSPDAPVTTLTLRVGIPKLVEMTPRLLRWAPEEAREAKTVDVVFHEKSPVVVTAAKAGDAAVELEFEEVEEGRHYRVTARPTGPEALRAVVTLVTERGEAEDQANPLRFLIRAPGSDPGTSAAATPDTSSKGSTDEKAAVPGT